MTLQERLRTEARATEDLHPDDSEIEVMREAADEIDRLTRERDEAEAIMDRYEVARPCSSDGGKTWEPWPLLKRIEIICMAATDEEDRERAESAETELSLARAERDTLRAALHRLESAAKVLKFSAYPAHGSGYVTIVSGGSIADLKNALAATPVSQETQTHDR